jgi:tetratricopeptide (TPR) repeat protein
MSESVSVEHSATLPAAADTLPEEVLVQSVSAHSASTDAVTPTKVVHPNIGSIASNPYLKHLFQDPTSLPAVGSGTVDAAAVNHQPNAAWVGIGTNSNGTGNSPGKPQLNINEPMPGRASVAPVSKAAGTSVASGGVTPPGKQPNTHHVPTTHTRSVPSSFQPTATSAILPTEYKLRSTCAAAFACVNCSLPVEKPVMVQNGEKLSCRNCAAPGQFQECPPFWLHFYEEIQKAFEPNPTVAAPIPSAGVHVTLPVVNPQHAHEKKHYVKVKTVPPSIATNVASEVKPAGNSPSRAPISVVEVLTPTSPSSGATSAQPAAATAGFPQTTPPDAKVTSLNPNLDHSAAAKRNSRSSTGNASTEAAPQQIANSAPPSTTIHAQPPAEVNHPSHPVGGKDAAEAEEAQAALEEEQRRRAEVQIQQAILAEAFAKLDQDEKIGRRQVGDESKLAFVDIQEKVSRSLKAISEETSKALRAKADEMYEAQRYADAITLYSKALARNDGTCKPVAILGNRSAAYFMSGEYRQAINDCMAGVKVDPTNVKLWLRAIRSCIRLGDLAQAQITIKLIDPRVMESQLKAEEERINRGVELLLKAESPGTPQAEVEENYKMLMTDFTENPTFFRLKFAECMFKQGKYDAVVDNLQKISAACRTPDVNFWIANALYHQGFEYFDRARSILSIPVREGDRRCSRLLDLINTVDQAKVEGNSNFGQRKFKESAEAYTRAIDADSSNSNIVRILYCNRAASYKELGRYREGIEDCNKAIAIDPDFAKAYARRARCHQQLNEFFQAVRDFKKAVSLDRSDSDFARELRLAEQAKKDDEAKDQDLYHVLGVSRSASAEEIKKAHRELMLKYHPDRNVNLTDEDEKKWVERKAKAVANAWETLKDPHKKADYDAKPYARRAGGMGGEGERHSAYHDAYSAATGTGPYGTRRTQTSYGSGHFGTGGAGTSTGTSSSGATGTGPSRTASDYANFRYPKREGFW